MITYLGQELSREQRYYGLPCRLGDQIGLAEPMVAFWRQNKEIGPQQRRMRCGLFAGLPGKVIQPS